MQIWISTYTQYKASLASELGQGDEIPDHYLLAVTSFRGLVKDVQHIFFEIVRHQKQPWPYQVSMHWFPMTTKVVLMQLQIQITLDVSLKFKVIL